MARKAAVSQPPAEDWMGELPADTLPSMALWLQARIERIRHAEYGYELYDEVTTIVGDCWRQVDRPATAIYAGPCGNTDCDGEVYLRPGERVGRCRECRTPYEPREVEDIRAAAEEQMATASAAAQILVWLGYRQVTASAIRGRAHRGDLLPRSTDIHGRPMYSVGDILDLIDPERGGERTAS